MGSSTPTSWSGPPTTSALFRKSKMEANPISQSQKDRLTSPSTWLRFVSSLFTPAATEEDDLVTPNIFSKTTPFVAVLGNLRILAVPFFEAHICHVKSSNQSVKCHQTSEIEKGKMFAFHKSYKSGKRDKTISNV